MSRFFTAGDSSSESSSDEEELYSDGEAAKDEEESSSEEEASDESSSDEEEGGKTGASRFMKGDESGSDSGSDSDTPKVVKSAKSKRLEELDGVVKLIDNAIKINDWSSISTGDFISRARRCNLSDALQNLTSSIVRSPRSRPTSLPRPTSKPLRSWRT